MTRKMRTAMTKANIYAMAERTGKERLAKIDAMFGYIKRQMQQPAFEDETPKQMRARADRRRDMATSVRLNRGQVYPEYEPIDLNEEL
jgi:hypothetical protein